MRIGFTGAQRGLTIFQALALGRMLSEDFDFHHGDCIGADARAHDIARLVGCYIVSHPPVNPAKRAWKHADFTEPPFDYLMRNRHIVDRTDRLIATPGENIEQLRSGTWATIRYARKLGRSITIIYPEGECVS